jgi:hypothetical protein
VIERIERIETTREVRTVTIKLGVFELEARQVGRSWAGSVYFLYAHFPTRTRSLLSCDDAESADAVFGHLVGELATLHHQTGAALEAARHACIDCDRELPLAAPDLCEGCGATCNPADTICYACGASLSSTNVACTSEVVR